MMMPRVAEAPTFPVSTPRYSLRLMPLSMLDQPIERIGVFRALMLGDLLCAVPALRALRTAFPSAEITLIGLPWAAGLARRLSCLDHFIEFPGYPGLPETACDHAALPGFLERVQAQHFDLVLQLHGSGVIVNPLVAAFGAKQTAGFFVAEGWVPPADKPRYVPWPRYGHEIERLLTLTDALGMRRCGTHLEFPVNEDDRAALRTLWPGYQSSRPYICVHPGAQLSSRRWSPQRFAAVADALAVKGYTIVLTGSASEVLLTASVAAAMTEPAVSLAGQTSLGVLGALIEGAARIVCNDTGVSHIAAALGTPSVVISCGADVARWAPLDSRNHRVLWEPMHCRPCSHAVCPDEHGCAVSISTGQVLDALHSNHLAGALSLVELPPA